MTIISHLSFDLVEEILCRVPITSLVGVRSTCKRWNSLSKENSFTKKHSSKAPKEYLVNMTWDGSISNSSLKRFSLHNIKDLPSLKKIGNIRRPLRVNKVLKVCHSEGLLLYIPEDNSRLVVWNPYLAQARRIKARGFNYGTCLYAIGYDYNSNHKILRSFPDNKYIKYEIYDLKTNFWRVLDDTTNFRAHYNGVSLKGNTYFVGISFSEDSFVICFDFTTERFGPHMCLPFHSSFASDIVSSCVREEQLAVLHENCQNTYVELWITTKIEPNTILWSKFFKVDRQPLFRVRSFFIDKEKKIAVVSGNRWSCYDTSYVVGEDGNYKEIGLKKDVFSYVPSLVCIQ